MFESPVGLQEIRRQKALLAAMCDSLDPSLLPEHEVAEAFQTLLDMGKLIAGAGVRMTYRYEESGAWKAAGAKSPEDDIARRSGTSASRAKKNLDTSRRVRTLPGTDDALRRGTLSPEQADEVAAGADASPDDEDDLLDAARDESLSTLRQRAAAARAKADEDREATRRRRHKARRVGRWTDEDGMYNLLLKTTPEVGAEIDASLKTGIDRAFADGRDAGRFEPYGAHAADVVAARLSGRVLSDSPGGGDRVERNQAVRADRKVIARIDVAALNRGAVEGDETCEIAGVGPVSVPAIRRLLSDAVLALVITRGVDVLNVTHLGRQVTAHQRTALEQRGYRCEVCGSTHHLDIDHNEGWTLTHDTKLDDLSWLCGHDHDRKTRGNLRLVGPPGKRRLVPRGSPPDPEGSGAAPPPPPASSPQQDDLFSLAT